jgi:hypothetical protein
VTWKTEIRFSRRSCDWLHCRAHSPVYRFTDLASCNLYLNISSTPTHNIPRASFDCLSPHLSPTEHSLSSAYSWVAMSLRPGSSNPGPSSRKRRRTSPREFDDSRSTARSMLFPVSSQIPGRTDTMTESHTDLVLTGVLWLPAPGHPCSSSFQRSWTERSIGV